MHALPKIAVCGSALFLLHHKAAALFEVIPAWLRFLQSKSLIDDEQRARTLEELRPLHADVLKLMESYTEDPTLSRAMKRWPSGPTRSPQERRACPAERECDCPRNDTVRIAPHLSADGQACRQRIH